MLRIKHCFPAVNETLIRIFPKPVLIFFGGEGYNSSTCVKSLPAEAMDLKSLHERDHSLMLAVVNFGEVYLHIVFICFGKN